MDDYIKREDAIQTLVGITAYNNVEEIQAACVDSYARTNGWLGGVRDSIAALEEVIPVADVRPVIPAQWIALDIYRSEGNYKCSHCEQPCYVPECMGEPMYAVCPNCGADMRPEGGTP